MLKKIIDRLLRRRHYWRDVTFDELSELYTNSLLRSLAESLIGIFVPIFLYRSGFSLQSILGYYVIWFIFKIPANVVNASLVGRFGPKHCLALASFGNILYLMLLLTLHELHWPLMVLAVVGGWSLSLHLIAFHTDFSKVKHTEHGGKELGYATIMIKIGGIIGPLVGGLLATFFDPRYTIALAIVFQIIALVPLFLTQEPVKTRQKIHFRGLAYRRHVYDYIAAFFASLENFISLIIWPLFIAVVALGSGTYAKIGIIVAASTALSILVSKVIGTLIDESKGELLLRTNTILNALLHLARPFISTFQGALTVNLLNDPITSGYRMPFIKGIYDAADSLPGYRIAYLSSMAVLEDIGKTLLCFFAWFACRHFSSVNVLEALFVVAALASLGIMFERFPALRQDYN